jgi:hypothetical protein
LEFDKFCLNDIAFVFSVSNTNTKVLVYYVLIAVIDYMMREKVYVYYCHDIDLSNACLKVCILLDLGFLTIFEF